MHNKQNFVSNEHLTEMIEGLREVYACDTFVAAEARLRELSEAWRPSYPKMVAGWEAVWSGFAAPPAAMPDRACHEHEEVVAMINNTEA